MSDQDPQEPTRPPEASGSPPSEPTPPSEQGQGGSGDGTPVRGAGASDPPPPPGGASTPPPPGGASVPPPPPGSTSAAAPPPTGTSSGGKGLFGCLGCFGVAVILLIAIPIVLIAGFWFMLPRVVAPADTEWVMVAPDPERGAEVRRTIEEDLARLDTGERTTVELTEADLNQLLANALAERRVEEETTGPPPQARFRIGENVMYLDAMVMIPEELSGIPGRLRGQPTGMQLGLTPRAAGDFVAMRIRDVRLGKIPVPVDFAMRMLARSEDADEIPFLNPGTGELRLSLRQLGGIAEGMTLHDLRVGDGVLRLELSR